MSASLGSANGSVADLSSAAALAGQASSDGGRGNTTPVQVRADASFMTTAMRRIGDNREHGNECVVPILEPTPILMSLICVHQGGRSMGAGRPASISEIEPLDLTAEARQTPCCELVQPHAELVVAYEG